MYFALAALSSNSGNLTYLTGCNAFRALNYGAVGWIIGHEISHGFDSIGRHYDKDGNLRDWWKVNATIEAFERRGQCIVDEFNALCYPNLLGQNECVSRTMYIVTTTT